MQTHSRHTISRGLGALTLFVLAAVLFAACGNSASQPSSKGTANETPLEKGLAFYKGKTITFIAPDKPGGGFDQYTRTYAPYLESYLHATINVLNVPAGNTVTGQNQVASSTANGLTVGWLNAGSDVEDAVLGLPGLTFNPLNVALLGGTAPYNDAIVALTSPACSSWTNRAALVHNSTAQNPVKELIQTTGTTTFVLVLANAVFGVHASTASGYASSSDLLQGFQRGDGCVVIDPVSTLGPLVAGGQARPLLLNVALQPTNTYAKYFASTPTIATAETQYATSITTPLQTAGEKALNSAATSTRGFFAPAGTPSAQVVALTAAFKSASENKTLQSQLVKQGNPTGYQLPTAERSSYQGFLAAAKNIGADLGPIKSG